MVYSNNVTDQNCIMWWEEFNVFKKKKKKKWFRRGLEPTYLMSLTSRGSRPSVYPMSHFHIR